ncbi:polysaccharide deacetylase family protein [Geodermatophilus sp. SYSU D00703]
MTPLVAVLSGALVLAPLAVPVRAPADGFCSAGHVRLTFDDGPSPTGTPQVLDALAARDATATSFVVGSLAAAYPGLLRRASQEGHAIGNHSWSHPDPTTLDETAVRGQLQRTDDALQEATGAAPTEWRPPYGARNAAVQAVARDVGLDPMVLWDVDPTDWADPPATTVRDRVLRDVHPGAVVLLHDATGANTPEAVPLVLQGLAELGYCTR